MAFYFDKFEDRKPPEPLPHSIPVELAYQFFATVTLVFGGWYIYWRWTASLNYDAMWFAIPLVVAETFAYIGLVLFTSNLWQTKDYKKRPPPETITDCVDEDLPARPIVVDVFFPTYDEDPELVRLSIIDGKNVSYPHNIDIFIHVLDDGKREEMRKVAEEEGVNYITRENNVGFKAGNLRNAMEQTHGDFIVICDADTRPFPTFLEHTLGYFRDPDVAWVQTPQWFFDIPEGERLPKVLNKKLGGFGKFFGQACEAVLGKIQVGRDPFVNDPKMFYDIIQRRRNGANAAFCCGAGSIHRREAVMQAALKGFALQVDEEVDQFAAEVDDEALRDDLSGMMKHQALLETEFTPYKFHVSEDIYTSIVLHSDQDRQWKSVLHPDVESKMLSPQDLESWMVQRFKYAGGTLDIAVNDNPLMMKGMTLRQRAMYATTIYSYFGGIWNTIFLVSPIIYLFTGIAPVSAYNFEFFVHILPFLILNEISTMFGTWGINGYQGKSSYLSFFPVNLRAIWTVMKGEKIKFPTTPKERQEGNFFHHVIPQFLIIALTALGLVYAGVGLFIGTNENLYGFITNILWGLNNIIAMSGL
ncbi:MAG: glycosyltransferase, partial [Pseudomonadota bacterium]